MLALEYALDIRVKIAKELSNRNRLYTEFLSISKNYLLTFIWYALKQLQFYAYSNCVFELIHFSVRASRS